MRIFLIPLILLGFPTVEVLVMVLVAQKIGWWLLVWLLATLAAGLALLRLERFNAPARLLAAVAQGEDPLRALFASGRVILAGLLLAFPGLVSDGLAVLVLIWPRGRKEPAARRLEVIEGQFRRED